MKKSTLFCILIVGATFAVLSLGCIMDVERFHRPNLFHPGHITEQQDRMRQFDPYARTDIGPKIDADRPHGADRPATIPKQLDNQRVRNGY